MHARSLIDCRCRLQEKISSFITITGKSKHIAKFVHLPANSILLEYKPFHVPFPHSIGYPFRPSNTRFPSILFHSSLSMKTRGQDFFICPETKISAVILDLDGTLLNSEKATKNVLKDFLSKYGKEVDAAKEEKRLGQMQNESAAAIVKDYNLPLTPEEFSREIMPYYKARWPDVKPLPGANRLIDHLHKHRIPFALASNSVKEDIELKISCHKGWKESFSVILGSNEVKSGKPAPDIFLEAAKRMDADAAYCLVIEDSLPGVTAAKAAGMMVVAVTSPLTQDEHFSVAHCILHSLLEFKPEKWGLPEFDDWVQNALPIETLHIKGLLSGSPYDSSLPLTIIPDQASNELLPDQVVGVYFGWAKIGTYGIFKMVVSVGWDLYPGIAKRVIQPYMLHELNKDCPSEQLEMWIVGFIRQLPSEENIMAALGISPEDKSTAEAALDLPTFRNQQIVGSAKDNASCNCKRTCSSNGPFKSGET